jgi:hypothetical protein
MVASVVVPAVPVVLVVLPAVVDVEAGAAVVVDASVVVGEWVVVGLEDELLQPANPRAATATTASDHLRTRDMEVPFRLRAPGSGPTDGFAGQTVVPDPG